MRRSTSSLSYFMALWNCSGKFSPKKTISGFMIASGSSAGHLGQRGTTCTKWESEGSPSQKQSTFPGKSSRAQVNLTVSTVEPGDHSSAVKTIPAKPDNQFQLPESTGWTEDWPPTPWSPLSSAFTHVLSFPHAHVCTQKILNMQKMSTGKKNANLTF